MIVSRLRRGKKCEIQQGDGNLEEIDRADSVEVELVCTDSRGVYVRRTRSLAGLVYTRVVRIRIFSEQ